MFRINKRKHFACKNYDFTFFIHRVFYTFFCGIKHTTIEISQCINYNSSFHINWYIDNELSEQKQN